MTARVARTERRALEELVARLATLAASDGGLVGWRARSGELARRLEALAERARSAEKTLCVLLLGGTGVGKSTLLNALAHEQVSLPSHALRGFTRGLVLYHHADAPLEALVRDHEARCTLAPHRAEPLRDKVVIDAPDVDSSEPENRALVEAFLPRVDLVLYVTSWQKYKDRDLVVFVAGLKGAHAFTFVLNQVDVLDEDERALVAADFRALLASLGFEQPEVLCISARRACVGELADAGDFARLEELLRERIRGEEIRRIQHAGLIGRLEQEVELLGAAAAEGSGLAPKEHRDALGAAAGAVSGCRASLIGSLSDELAAVVELARRSYERRYHELRDREAVGPYGLFLRLVARLSGDPLEVGFALPRARALAVRASLARALEQARAAVRPLAVLLPELDRGRPDDLAERLVDSLRHASDAAWLADLPRARPALAINALPVLLLVLLVARFFQLALTGRDPGLAFLLAGLLVVLGACYGQMVVLRALDRRRFRAAVRGRTPDARAIVRDEPLYQELEASARRLVEARERLDELELVRGEVRALRESLRELPAEVRV